MLTLATGNKGSSLLRQQKGLTLVEVLVVIAMLGVVATVVVLTLPEEKSPVEQAAFKLGRSIKSAKNYAIMSGKIIGLDMTETGYQFLTIKEGEWVPFVVPGGRRQSVSVDDGIKIEINKEVGITAGTAGVRGRSTDKTKAELVPELTIYPSGNGSSADFFLQDEEERWHVAFGREIHIRQVSNDEF